MFTPLWHSGTIRQTVWKELLSLFPDVASATWRRSTSRRASTTSSPPPSYPNRRVPSSWTLPALRPSRSPSSSEDGAGTKGLTRSLRQVLLEPSPRFCRRRGLRASARTWWYHAVLANKLLLSNHGEELQHVSGQIKIHFHQHNIQTATESRCTSFCHINMDMVHIEVRS